MNKKELIDNFQDAADSYKQSINLLLSVNECLRYGFNKFNPSNEQENELQEQIKATIANIDEVVHMYLDSENLQQALNDLKEKGE